MPKQGAKELSAALGGRFLNDADNMLMLMVRADIYYTDLLVLGVRAEAGLGSDSSHVVAAEALYLFPVDQVSALYAGITAGAGIVDIDKDSDLELKTSGIAGYKRYTPDGVGVYGEVELGSYLGDSTESFYGLTVGFMLPF
jgi:hypothetical protein